MMITIDTIDKLLAPKIGLEAIGFKHVSYDHNLNTAFFVRSHDQKGEVISYTYGGHTHGQKYSDKVFIGSLSVRYSITFNNVSSILSRFEEKQIHNDWPDLHGGTLIGHPSLSREKEIILFQEDKVLEENFDLAAQRFRAHIDRHVLPFFERVNTLQIVNDEIIDRIPHSELLDYLPGKRMPWIKLIVMKLCRNPKYGEYMNWLDQNYRSVDLMESSTNDAEYRKFKGLASYLDAMMV